MCYIMFGYTSGMNVSTSGLDIIIEQNARILCVLKWVKFSFLSITLFIDVGSLVLWSELKVI